MTSINGRTAPNLLLVAFKCPTNLVHILWIVPDATSIIYHGTCQDGLTLRG